MLFCFKVWCVECSEMLFCFKIWCVCVIRDPLLLQGLMCWVVRDALLQMDVTSMYLSYSCLSISWTSLIIILWPLESTRHFLPQNWQSLDFSFLDHYLETLEMVVRENPSRSAVTEIIRPTTRPHSKSLKGVMNWLF